VARYRITFDVAAVDQDDAKHWAFWVAGAETVMRDVDVVSVVRLGPSLAPEVQERDKKKPTGRDRDSKDYGLRPRHGSA
jgi:hypothetical protein